MFEPVDREAERELFDRIDPDEMARHLDAFEGLERVSGTEAEWEASEYIVETLEEYGLDASMNAFDGYVSVPESATVEVTSPSPRTFEEAITVSFGASTPRGGVSGELVSFDDLGGDPDDLPDLTGKVLFVEGLSAPHLAVAATEANAEALIFASPDDHVHEGIVSPVWGTPDTESVDDLPDVPVASLPGEAGEWVADRFAHGTVEVSVETSVRTEVMELPNPVGKLEGAESDRYFVVGNHVDSWYEGITDNATAMATTLEVARIMAEEEPKRGLVVGFWTAHSTGRYTGSTRYVDDNWLDLRANGVAYLHIDLVGLDGADALWFQHMAELGAEHRDAMETATDFEVGVGGDSFLGAAGRPARNSDQSFWGTGLSSLLSGARFEPGTERGGPVGGGWWWHTPDDTRDKVDMDVLAEETKLYVALASRICNSPALPHDYRAVVDDFEEMFDDVEEAAGEDLGFDAARADLDSLDAALESAYEIAGGAGDDPALATAVEDLQVDLGNTLTPALYTSGPDTEQEPATPYARLPALRAAADLSEQEGAKKLFAETETRRGLNRVRHRIQDATERTERFTENWG
jgi:hypothetical protein